jgi:hypothetical protein
MQGLWFVGRVFLLVVLIGTLKLFPALPKDVDSVVQVFLAIVVGSLLQSFASSWGNIRFIAKLIWITILMKELRISFSALIKIKIGDNYLLVRGRRFPHFQPVGGVYKFFDKEIRHRFGLVNDELKAKDVDELRLVFPRDKVWHVFDFLGWFHSRKGRESGPHREFAEELIGSNILSASVFADVPFEYKKTITSPIDFSTHLQKYELFCFEIYEAIMSDVQVAAVDALRSIPSSEYCFLTEDEIKRNGYRPDGTVPIGSHTRHIL